MCRMLRKNRIAAPPHPCPPCRDSIEKTDDAVPRHNFKADSTSIYKRALKTDRPSIPPFLCICVSTHYPIYIYSVVIFSNAFPMSQPKLGTLISTTPYICSSSLNRAIPGSSLGLLHPRLSRCVSSRSGPLETVVTPFLVRFPDAFSPVWVASDAACIMSGCRSTDPFVPSGGSSTVSRY
jgi:hypothetical protein